MKRSILLLIALSLQCACHAADTSVMVIERRNGKPVEFYIDDKTFHAPPSSWNPDAGDLPPQLNALLRKATDIAKAEAGENVVIKLDRFGMNRYETRGPDRHLWYFCAEFVAVDSKGVPDYKLDSSAVLLLLDGTVVPKREQQSETE